MILGLKDSLTFLSPYPLHLHLQKMAYILHIDTSGDTGTIAIAKDGELVCMKENTEARNHASSINVMIADVLKEAGITFADLAAVVVCGGPGSYTGLRIGMATAKGLCYSLDIPLLAHNKLTLLAYQTWKGSGSGADYYVPLLLAREGEYFISVFNNKFENEVEATHIIVENIRLVLGERENICLIAHDIPDENHKKYANNVSVVTNVAISLKWWCFYTFEQYKCKIYVNLSTAEPYYLKQVYTHK